MVDSRKKEPIPVDTRTAAETARSISAAGDAILNAVREGRRTAEADSTARWLRAEARRRALPPEVRAAASRAAGLIEKELRKQGSHELDFPKPRRRGPAGTQTIPQGAAKTKA